MDNATIYDFFISYKRKDTAEFVEYLKDALEAHKPKYDVWLDKTEILPGDSILSSIEKGLTNSLTIILVFSEHYFEGWSEHERRAVFNLFNSGKVQIIPIWYKIDTSFIQRNAPLFADIAAIVYDPSKQSPENEIFNQLTKAIRPSDRRSKLFEFFLKCLIKHFPNDPDLKFFIAAAWDQDVTALKEALEAGANLNVTDTQLYNKYARESMNCGCFHEWKKLYFFFHDNGLLESQK